jgi:WD40 repeat protein/uncharacterized caspase-like protein
VLTGGGDQRVILWDVRTGKQLRTFHGLTTSASYVRFTGDARHVAAAGHNSTSKEGYGDLLIWDRSTGQMLQELRGIPSISDFHCALNSDGSRLVTASNAWQETVNGRPHQPPCEIQLWDVAKGEQMSVLAKVGFQIESLSLSSDEKLVAAGGSMPQPGGEEGRLALCDMATQRLLAEWSTGGMSVEKLEFSPDGQHIFCASWDGSVKIWDTATHQRQRELTGHRSDVERVVYSPDGRTVATASYRLIRRPGSDANEYDREGEIIVWDAQSGLLQRLLRAHSDEITGLAFSADGRRLASVSKDGAAILWDMRDGTQIKTFKEGRRLDDVAFSPDGRQLLIAGDAKAVLWDIESAQKVRVFERGCSRVAFASNGAQVLTDGVLWDVSTVEKLHEFGTEQGFVHAWPSLDGRHVVALSSSHGKATIWDVETRRAQQQFNVAAPDKFVTWQEARLHGPRLFTLDGFESHEFVVWDTMSGQQLRRISPVKSPERIKTFALSPDGKFAVLGVSDRADIYEMDSAKRVHSLKAHHGSLKSFALRPNTNQIVTVAGTPEDVGGEALVWDASTGRQTRKFESLQLPPDAVAYSPDGRYLAGGLKDGRTLIWDADIGHVVRTLEGWNTDVQHLAFASDGGSLSLLTPTQSVYWELGNLPSPRLTTPDGLISVGDPDFAVVHYPQERVVLWDLRANREKCTLQAEKSGFLPKDMRWWRADEQGPLIYPDFHRLSRDRRYLLTSTFGPFLLDGGTWLWDAQTGDRICRLQDHGGWVATADFSPDGTKLITGSNDHRAIVWDIATGEALQALEHSMWVKSVVFSPDSRLVMVGDLDGTAILWDVVSGKKLRVFADHSPSVTSVAFSPDGTKVITAEGCGAINVWELATGKMVRRFSDHETVVDQAAISPDSQRLASRSRDGTLRLWDLASGEPIYELVSTPEGTLLATPDHYYCAPRGAQAAVAFRIGQRALPLAQFDLRFNRPDLVLARISGTPPELIAAYRRAYDKRLRRMHFTEEMLGDEFHLPEAAIASGASFATPERFANLQLKASDSKYFLDRVNVYVNGVPIYGTAGIPLRDRQINSWQQDLRLELSVGRNRIEISAINDKGAESLRDGVEIVCTAPVSPPKLYVLTIGVSEYADHRYQLTYPDKDARDLSDFFQSSTGPFGAVLGRRLLNEDATKEKILASRTWLEQAEASDHVVVFLAGHGLLDERLDYYFATVDVDFQKPAGRGLPYEAIEGLLDGLKARNKLLLLDTCHAGELDKDEFALADAAIDESGVKVRGLRGAIAVEEHPFGLGKTNQVLEELFADLRRGTGAMVISASGGAEFAMESKDWNNGVFTYAVLTGLKQGKADRSGDGRIVVSELRDYVVEEVRRLTHNRQTPTARRENLELDFVVQ